MGDEPVLAPLMIVVNDTMQLHALVGSRNGCSSGQLAASEKKLVEVSLKEQLPKVPTEPPRYSLPVDESSPQPGIEPDGMYPLDQALFSIL